LYSQVSHATYITICERLEKPKYHTIAPYILLLLLLLLQQRNNNVLSCHDFYSDDDDDDDNDDACNVVGMSFFTNG